MSSRLNSYSHDGGSLTNLTCMHCGGEQPTVFLIHGGALCANCEDEHNIERCNICGELDVEDYLYLTDDGPVCYGCWDELEPLDDEDDEEDDDV